MLTESVRVYGCTATLTGETEKAVLRLDYFRPIKRGMSISCSQLYFVLHGARYRCSPVYTAIHILSTPPSIFSQDSRVTTPQCKPGKRMSDMRKNGEKRKVGSVQGDHDDAFSDRERILAAGGATALQALQVEGVCYG
jgi:hypothetical protein